MHAGTVVGQDAHNSLYSGLHVFFDPLSTSGSQGI